MRSMIVFRMAQNYLDKLGKKPLDIVMEVIREHVPPDIKQSKHNDIIRFEAPGWDFELVEKCPINDPDHTAFTVTFNQIPEGNLLMHHLMLLNKEAKSDVITDYKSNYPTQENL